MSTDVPLLNDYKKRFVRNRLLQTFLGGIRLTGVPCFAKAIQLALFYLPVAAVIVTVSGVIPRESDHCLYRIAFLAPFLLAYTLLLQVIAHCAHRMEQNAVVDFALEDTVVDLADGGEAADKQQERQRARSLRRHQQILFNDDDDGDSMEMVGCCSAKTWTFIIARKKFLPVSLLLHSIMAALVGVTSVLFLDVELTERVMGGSYAEAVVIVVFGWISVTIALFGLMVWPPPETATFRALDPFEFGPMSRPLHVVILALPQIIALSIETTGNFGGLQGYWYGPGPWEWLSWLTHIVLATAPLLWLAGLFPPFEAFILWFGEQLQMFAFGGSATTSQLRFWTYLGLSLTQLIVLYLLSYLDMAFIITLASVSGYLLSLDLVGIFKQILRGPAMLLKRDQCRAEAEMDSFSDTPVSVTKSGKRWNRMGKFSRIMQSLKEVLSHAFFFCANGAVVHFAPYDQADLDSTRDTLEAPLEDMLSGGNSTTNSTSEISMSLSKERYLSFRLSLCGWLAVVFFLLVKVTCELQKVFFCCGLFRSPLYSSSQNGLCASIWHHIRSLSVNFLLPLFLTFYAKSLILEDSLLVQARMPLWVETVATLRVMRWIWQSPESALLEGAALHAMIVILEPLTDDTFYPRMFFLDLSRPVQMLLVGFMRDRGSQMVEKLYFVVGLAISSLEDRASKRSYAGFLFQINILFSPIILLFIFVSSLISAPMLAFFTLPIFFIAFPRPLRFWSEPIGLQANAGPHTVYYRQLMPALVTELQRANRAGRMGVLQPGGHLIGRHGDRIIWLQVLEKGNNYIYVGAKGMELQETSCHSLEATRLDDIFQETFEKRTSVNLFAFHAVTPLLQLPVRMYSDAKGVLTGVIESPDTLKGIGRIYMKTLVWYIIKHVVEQASKRPISNSTVLKRSAGKKSESSVRESARPSTSGLTGQIIETNPEDDRNDVIRIDQPEDDEVEHDEVFATSDSIKNVNLESWPATSEEPSPEQATAEQHWANKTSRTTLESNRRSSAYQRQRSESEPSLLGNMSDLDDHDEDENGGPPSSLKRNLLLPPLKGQQQRMEHHDSLDSFDKLEHMFVMPGGIDRTPVVLRKQLPDKKKKVSEETTTSEEDGAQNAIKMSSLWADRFCPDPRWIISPRQDTYVDSLIRDEMPLDWLKEIMKVSFSKHLLERGEVGGKEQVQILLEDLDLIEAYSTVLKHCFFAVYGLGQGSNLDGLVLSHGPKLPVRVYGNDLPVSTHTEWMLEETGGQLFPCVLMPAFRAAVKLSLDEAILGDDFTVDMELTKALTEIDSSWYLGLEEDPAWQQAVLAEMPNLFSVSASEGAGRGVSRQLFRSQLLTLTTCDVSVARVNPEVVKGLWASLNLELLYLTNDDDERYSIQAEERLLRNLTVQVADPPLGYSIFSSPAMRQGIQVI